MSKHLMFVVLKIEKLVLANAQPILCAGDEMKAKLLARRSLMLRVL